jgi:DNA polymerase III epsilon subunit-like protein
MPSPRNSLDASVVPLNLNFEIALTPMPKGPTMREIVIDTETTGLDPVNGHRIVGAVEFVNRSLTGQTYHCYLCPERSMPAEALAVHGLSGEFLGGTSRCLVRSPTRPSSAMRRWWRTTRAFDIAFLNAELKRAAKPPIATERAVDTLVLARRKHPPSTTRSTTCVPATALIAHAEHNPALRPLSAITRLEQPASRRI